MCANVTAPIFGLLCCRCLWWQSGVVMSQRLHVSWSEGHAFCPHACSSIFLRVSQRVTPFVPMHAVYFLVSFPHPPPAADSSVAAGLMRASSLLSELQAQQTERLSLPSYLSAEGHRLLHSPSQQEVGMASEVRQELASLAEVVRCSALSPRPM